MENSTYLPNSALKAEFEEFRKLKTTKEKDAFQKRIKAEFNKKTIFNIFIIIFNF